MRCLGHDTGRRSILKSRRFSLTRMLTGVKVIKTQFDLTTGYAVNRNVSIEMKNIQGVISRTMSHANHLAKETLFAIMPYSQVVRQRNLTPIYAGSNPARVVCSK